MLIAGRLVFEVLPLLNALTAGLRAAVDGLEQFHHLPVRWRSSYARDF
jgi:hypothetical protein